MVRAFGWAAILTLAATAAAAQAGSWRGEMTLDGSTVAVVVHLEESAGGWSGTLDVPPQAIEGLPLEELAIDGESVAFSVPGLPGAPRFEGSLDGSAFAGSVEADASRPPATDIEILPLERDESGAWAVLRPYAATDRDGYDNQPAFLPDGSALLYTSQRGDQSDVYRYDMRSGRSERVTDTAESEYSPTPMPDGERFSVVRVEPDGTQRLWAFPLAGGDPELLLPDVAPVGYHAWLDEDTVALFVLGDPITLQIASVASGASRVVAENVGRSLHRIPGTSALSYLDQSAEPWMLRRFDPEEGSTSILGKALPESEDYAWAPDGSLVMGSATVLFRGLPGNHEIAWSALTDLADEGLGGITRLAVSPDGRSIAFVVERPAAGTPETVTGTFALRRAEHP
ncbi:MAG: hypothetical protein R2991_15680 [Thermoanaerobaculia bacterium]